MTQAEAEKGVPGLGRQATRGAMITLAAQWSRFAIQFLSAIVMAHLLPPADFGLVVMVTAVAGIAQVMGDFGLSTATIQAQHVSRQQRSNIFWINLALGLALTAITYAVAVPISHVYRDGRIVGITRLVSVTFFFNAVCAQFRSELTRGLKFKWLSAADLLAQVGALGVGIALALHGIGYWSLVWQLVTLAAIPTIVLILGARWVPSLPRTADIGALFRFGRDNMIVQLINYVCSNIDTVLLGRFYGATPAALYGKAYQLVMLPLLQVLAPLSRVALPILSRVNEPREFQRYVERIYLVVSYVLIGVLAFFGAIVYPFVSIALGTSWLPAARIILVMLAGGVFECLTYPCSWIFLASGHARQLLSATLVTRPFMIALIVVGTLHGPVTTSLAVAVGFLFNWSFFMLYAFRRIGLDSTPVLLQVIRPMAIFSVTIALVSPLGWAHGAWHDPWAQTAIVLTAVIGLLGLAFVIYAPFRRDLRVILQTVRRSEPNQPARQETP